MMRVYFGKPFEQADPAGFDYYYFDINKPFFKKVIRESGSVYAPQRSGNVACEIPVVKSKNEVRIFIIGGSVANDWSENKGKDSIVYFENALKKLSPDKNFKIINCGMDGYDSYRESLVAKEISTYQPDLVIVMSGNNEWLYRSCFHLQAYLVNKCLTKSWIYRKFQDKIKNYINKDGPREKNRLTNFKRNINNIISILKAKDIPLVLCTLPVNFRDFPPPFIDRYPSDKQFFWAHLLLYNGDYFKAIDAFKLFLESNPADSFGFYFLGKSYDKTNDYKNARENYLKALELSSEAWLGANPSSNEFIRQICRKKNIALVDLEKIFLNESEFGLLGNEFFKDRCHWWDEYYPLAADSIICEILRNYKIAWKILGISANSSFLLSFSHDYNLVLPKDKVYTRSILSNAMKEVVEHEYKFSETVVSLFYRLDLIDPFELRNLKYQKVTVKKICLDNIQDFKNTPDFQKNFDKYWSIYLYYIGETYRRLRVFYAAVDYFNEAIFFNKNYYLPHLGKALVYFALGNKNIALKEIEKTKKLSDAPKIKLYEEILKQKHLKNR